MKKTNVLMSVLMTGIMSFSALAFSGCGEKVTISFETGTEETLETVKRKVGGTYGELPVPTKENYKFIGWATEKMNGEYAKQGVEVTKTYDHALYAKWKYVGEKKVSFPLGIEEVRLANGIMRSFYIDEEGNLFGWGMNDDGELANGTMEEAHTPTQIMPGTKFVHVAAGTKQTYAIDKDGNLWGWGDNLHGYLSGEVADRYVLTPIQIMPGTKFYKVSTNGGRRVTLAIDQSGGLWAWGDNFHGQLGQGTAGFATWEGDVLEGSSTPLRVKKGTRFIDAETSGEHCAAISEDGILWTWGYNGYGGLGNGKDYQKTGSFADLCSPTPKAVMRNVRFSEIEPAEWSTYAIDEDGNIWACGYNSRGQLGNGTKEDRYELVPITEGLRFSQVQQCNGGEGGIAVDEYGDLWYWGDDYWKLWDDVEEQLTPFEAMINMKVKWVTAAGHVLVINHKGELWGWGRNDSGRIGDGTTEHRSRNNPVRIF